MPSDSAATNACSLSLKQGAQVGCCHSVEGASKMGEWRCSYSPIHIAAIKGFVSAIDLLLQYGAELNQVCESGETALALAVQAGQADVVGFLLQQGCNVGIPNVIGHTAVHHAATRVAVSGGKILEQLLGAGAAVNSCDLAGWSPLHAAVTFCSDEISGGSAERTENVELLLRAMADVNMVTSIDSVWHSSAN